MQYRHTSSLTQQDTADGSVQACATSANGLASSVSCIVNLEHSVQLAIEADAQSSLGNARAVNIEQGNQWYGAAFQSLEITRDQCMKLTLCERQKIEDFSAKEGFGAEAAISSVCNTVANIASPRHRWLTYAKGCIFSHRNASRARGACMTTLEGCLLI